MDIIKLKCPNCGNELNVERAEQKSTTCKKCNAIINLQLDDILYNLEGKTEDYVKRADYYNENHIYNEAFWEYRKAWCLDQNNERVNYEMDRCSASATNKPKKRRIYEKIDDDMKGKAIKCPNCGNNLIIEDIKRKVIQCDHCRSSIVIEGKKDTYKEILDKVMYYYNEDKYDEALIELGELIVKDDNNKYYQFLVAIISNLNKNYYNDFPIIDERITDTFKDYYKSLITRTDKDKAYAMITNYVSKLYDIYFEEEYIPSKENNQVLETIIEFLKELSLILDQEELKINIKTREDISKLMKRDK